MRSSSLLFCVGLAGAAGLRAAPAPASSAPAVDASLSTTAGYDSNLYLADAGVLGNQESTLTAVSAKISAKVAPGVSLAYSATATKFWDETREDNLRQTLAASWTGKLDACSWTAATEFAAVDGDDRGVDYGVNSGHAIGSAFSTAAPRERRDQLQNKTDLALRHDGDLGFVRSVGKLQYWDMQTASVGKCDYVDRHDIQGGLDLGRALPDHGPEYYLGYRYGYQFQDNDFDPAIAANASNHYDRYLVGLDGAPVKALKVNAQAGWARHAYAHDYTGSRREEGLFTDATLTWSVGSADELQAKTCQGRTISTTGKNSVLSSVHQLAWKHTFGPNWNATITGRLAEAEYAPYKRDDLDYAAIASVTWNATKNLGCTLAASRDWGRDHLNGLTGVAETNREFDRAFVSASVTWRR